MTETRNEHEPEQDPTHGSAQESTGEPGRVDEVDAAGRGETEPVLDRPAGATDPGSVGGDNGGA